MSDGGGKELNTKATLAGGGVGTLLIVVANQMPPAQDTLKAALIYFAPAVSVVGTAVWVFAASWVFNWRRRYVSDSALKRARDFRDRVCGDASASEEHKSAVRAKVEHFEKLTIALIENEFDSIEAKVRR